MRQALQSGQPKKSLFLLFIAQSLCILASFGLHTKLMMSAGCWTAKEIYLCIESLIHALNKISNVTHRMSPIENSYDLLLSLIALIVSEKFRLHMHFLPKQVK